MSGLLTLYRTFSRGIISLVVITLCSLGQWHACSAGDVVIFPQQIHLDSGRDRQSFVVQSTAADGITTDVTAEATVQLVGDAAQLEGHRLLPIRNGSAELKITYNGAQHVIPVSVQNADDQPEVSFRRDIIPLLTKSGCNSGRCHGASRGKDGFRLSLFGFDPKGDYYRITQEMPGRRINLAIPARSLIVRKAIGDVSHTGGELFSADSEMYATLLEWLEHGAQDDRGDVAIPVAIEVAPKSIFLNDAEQTQQLSVRVRYSDETDRDVTELATFISNNDNSAQVSELGLVTANKPGEAFVMVRFGTLSTGTGVAVIPHDATRPDVELYKRNNELDQLVNNKLRKLRIEPAPLCSDEIFLRRVYIDVAGRMPTMEEHVAFMTSKSEDKRNELIDELLESDDFIDLWAMRIGEMLRIRSDNQVSFKALYSYHHWLRNHLAADIPLNEIFSELLSSSGSTFESPQTNYFQIESNKQLLAENVAQSFLGMRIQCAQCHNHPFDRWSLDDYYGFLAFFGQVGYKQSNDPREFIVYNSGMGETRHLVDDRVMQPKFLGGDIADVEGKDYREVLASWLTSADNVHFSRHFSNLIWAHHMGRGIVDPIDDVRISNPPSNPELLDALAHRFVDYNFQIKPLIRDICRSRTYQLSTAVNATNEIDEANFSRALIRRIRAEVLLDSITQVTATEDRFSRLPAGARAIEIVDGAQSTYFLDTFGRAQRETVCACEVNLEPDLSQAFHLLNGDVTNDKVAAGGIIARSIDAGRSNTEIINELYLRCYSRSPMPRELQDLLDRVEIASDRQEVLQDVFWALLNSKEFIFNH